VLALAKGFRGRGKNCIRVARERLEKSLQYAYRDRRTKKRDMRSLWIQRINAGSKEYGVSPPPPPPPAVSGCQFRTCAAPLTLRFASVPDTPSADMCFCSLCSCPIRSSCTGWSRRTSASTARCFFFCWSDCQAHSEPVCKRCVSRLTSTAECLAGPVGASEHGAVELQGPGRPGEVHAWPGHAGCSSLSASQRQHRSAVMCSASAARRPRSPSAARILATKYNDPRWVGVGQPPVCCAPRP